MCPSPRRLEHLWKLKKTVVDWSSHDWCRHLWLLGQRILFVSLLLNEVSALGHFCKGIVLGNQLQPYVRIHTVKCWFCAATARADALRFIAFLTVTPTISGETAALSPFCAATSIGVAPSLMLRLILISKQQYQPLHVSWKEAMRSMVVPPEAVPKQQSPDRAVSQLWSYLKCTPKSPTVFYSSRPA